MLPKLYSTFAIYVLCICSVQICQSLDDQIKTKIYKDYYKFSDPNEYLNGSYAIKHISPEFIEDVQLILEKFDNNTYVTRNVLRVLEELATTYNGNATKITWDNMKKQLDYYGQSLADAIDLMQTIMLKQLPSERINGVLSLFYIIHGIGTKEDVENALGYLYGTVPRPKTLSPNIPSLTPMECTGLACGVVMYRHIDRLQGMKSSIEKSTKLNPKIVEDLLNIATKFEYNNEVYGLTILMKSLLEDLEKKNSKIEICELKNQIPWFHLNRWGRPNSDWSMKKYFAIITDVGMILPERMPEENFMDFLNLVRASYRIDGSDWEKALEYAYTPEYFNAEWCKQNAATN